MIPMLLGARTSTISRLIVALWIVLSTAALAAGPPQFKDYPVKKIFRGPVAVPVLTTRMARMFRTQLRNSVKYGPDFAGHYTLARWGCGAGCSTVAVIDAISGQVWFPPFSVEDLLLKEGVYCHRSMEFELDSELLIATGSLNDKVPEPNADGIRLPAGRCLRSVRLALRSSLPRALDP